MSIDDAILTGPVAKKLRNLPVHLPCFYSEVYSFASYFATRLPTPKMKPDAFLIVPFVALDELIRGVDCNEKNILPAFPSDLYAQLAPHFHYLIPKMAEVTCPADFAEKVKQLYELAEQYQEREPSALQKFLNGVGKVLDYITKLGER